MEEWGSGYKRVIHACQSGGYPEPDWEELGTAFRVIFHPHPAVLEHLRTDVPASVPASVPVNDRQRWFLEQLAAGKQIRASDLEEWFLPYHGGSSGHQQASNLSGYEFLSLEILLESRF